MNFEKNRIIDLIEFKDIQKNDKRDLSSTVETEIQYIDTGEFIDKVSFYKIENFKKNKPLLID